VPVDQGDPAAQRGLQGRICVENHGYCQHDQAIIRVRLPSNQVRPDSVPLDFYRRRVVDWRWGGWYGSAHVPRLRVLAGVDHPPVCRASVHSGKCSLSLAGRCPPATPLRAVAFITQHCPCFHPALLETMRRAGLEVVSTRWCRMRMPNWQHARTQMNRPQRERSHFPASPTKTPWLAEVP
jgi:hypothetical protein